MKVVIGNPGGPARIILRTRRQEDVEANLAEGEVAIDVTGQVIRIDGLQISADGTSVVSGSES
jgi:hypothetical protein